MILLPDFFQRRQTRLIRLRLPVGKVTDLLAYVDFGNDLGDAGVHSVIVRQLCPEVKTHRISPSLIRRAKQSVADYAPHSPQRIRFEGAGLRRPV